MAVSAIADGRTAERKETDEAREWRRWRRFSRRTRAHAAQQFTPRTTVQQAHTAAWAREEKLSGRRVCLPGIRV